MGQLTSIGLPSCSQRLRGRRPHGTQPFLAPWSTGAQSCGQALGLEPSPVAEGTFLVTWARHGDGEGGLVVKALELGTHCTGVTGGLLPSPCLTQFPAGLGQGGQRSASTSGLGLLCFSGIACSREGFLSCRLPISGPGNRLSSHGRKPLLLVKRYS